MTWKNTKFSGSQEDNSLIYFFLGGGGGGGGLFNYKNKLLLLNAKYYT